MTHTVLAVLLTVVVWWLSTGAVMIVARRAEGHRGLVLAGISAVAAASLAGLYLTARMETLAGVHLAFLSALGVWAWSETTFLIGAIAGPRRVALPAGYEGWARFRAAFAAVRDHEFAILASGLLVIALTWGAPNLVGLWTFLILWGMRISAKLNLFLGAPNAVSEMIPARLAYLTSYFRTDRVSPLFAVSIGGALIVFGAFALAGYAAAGPFGVAAAVVPATFIALAIIEHFFLVLPVSDAALWSWATGAPAGGAPPPEEAVEIETADDETMGWPLKAAAGKRGGVSWT